MGLLPDVLRLQATVDRLAAENARLRQWQARICDACTQGAEAAPCPARAAADDGIARLIAEADAWGRTEAAP